MEGSGTKDKPYLITNCEELQYAMLHGNGGGSAPYYYKVTRDLDCNEDKVYEWNVSTNSNIYYLDIDFDGHYITNVNIKKDGWFYGASGAYTRNLHDGAIINVYENGATGFIRDATLTNMAIDVHTNGFTQAPFQFNPKNKFGIDLCNIKYDCTGNELVNNNSYNCLFRNTSVSVSDPSIFIKNSKLTINGNYKNLDAYGLFDGPWTGSVSNNPIVSGCLIEGNIVVSDLIVSEHRSIISALYSMDGCVVNLNVSGTTFDDSHKLRLTGNTVTTLDKNVLVKNGDVVFDSEANVILATPEEVRNPDWLLSQGFFLGKEE